MCSVWLDVAEVRWESLDARVMWESHEGKVGWEDQGRLVMGSGREAQLSCLAAMGGLMKA